MTAFNGAMTFRSWIRRSHCRCQAQGVPFNGAMTFRSWIPWTC